MKLTRRRVGPGRTALGVAALLLSVGLLTVGSGSGTLTGLAAVLPSPLPNVSPPIPGPTSTPGQPAGPCSPPTLKPDELRLLYGMPSEGASTRGSVQVGVDQEASCHIYRSYAARADRSDNNGRSFGPSLPRGTSLGPAWVVSHVGYIADHAGGIYTTPNQGTTWAAANTGIGGIGFGTGIRALAVAPSEIRDAYAIASTSGQTVLYETTDLAQTWVPTNQPGADLTAVTVDSGDPQSVYVAASLPTPAVYESHTGGSTWKTHSAPPGTTAPVTLVVSHADGAPVLFAKMRERGLENWWRSTDGGTAWHPLGASTNAGPSTALAYDPSSPRRVIHANATGGVINIRASSDSFSTAPASRKIQSPFGNWGDVQLFADRAGNFFLQATALTGTEGTDFLYEFRFTAIPPPTPPPPPKPSSLQSCPLENVHRDPLQPPPPGKYQYPSAGQSTVTQEEWDFTSSSLAFDGKYLDYTYADADPAYPNAGMADPNYRSNTHRHGINIPGVIFRINPADCQRGTPIHINSADTGGVAQRIYFITYDPRYVFQNGRVGGLLVKGAYNGDPKNAPPGTAPVYAVDNTGHAEFVMAIPCPDAAKEVCGPESSANTFPVGEFAYDYFSNQVWISWTDNDGVMSNQLVALPNLKQRKLPTLGAPSCMNDYKGDDPFVEGPGQTSSFTVTGQGVAYESMEDNITIKRLDTVTCQVLSEFPHKPEFKEGMDENDQMACDPLTGGAVPKLWVRDQSANFLRSYPIPDGYCPFPDRLSLTNPVLNAVTGTPTQVCADLFESSADAGPIAGQPVTFSVASQQLGAANTDAAGRACASVTPPQQPGALALVASFAGTRGYLPARDIGTLNVPSVRSSGGQPGGRPPLPQARPLPPPPPVPIPVTGPGVQTASQFQAQTSAQVQPGVVGQEEERTQVEVQTIDGRKQTLSAVSRRPDDPTVAALMLQGSLVAGFVFLLYRRDRAIRRQLRALLRPARSRRD